MQLKSVHINGFKSFAKKSDLEFTTPITAVVGPNGSGKSNVAEAFRFVLGEQSIKSMRGKRGEDLIWSGSENTARANRASVTVVLDNSAKSGGTRTFPLDFDEIEIERTVHRDGTNEYSINGSRTRLRDVQELLAAANIGSTGHHIISQGEADRILSASPKERREMIEDALGLKVYQYKKAESEKKLKKTEENIAQVESLRKEVIPHLRFLERQVKKVEKSLELQETLKQAYAEYLRREDAYIAYHHDRLTKERIVPKEKLESLKEALEEARAKLEENKNDEKGEQLILLEKNIREVREERQTLVREVGQLEGQIEFLERRIKENAEKKHSEEHVAIPYGEAKKAVEAVEEEIEEALRKEDVSVFQKALSQIRDTLRRLLDEATDTDVSASLKDEEKELQKMKEEKASRDKDLGKVESKEKELNEEYEALRLSIEEESSESRAAERKVFEIMNEQRDTEHTLSTIDRELSVLHRDREEFKRELQEAVSLIGRAASSYYEHTVTDAEGKEVTREMIAAEKREVQHGRRRELEKMKIRLEELGVGSNEELMKEYKDVKERDEFLAREIADLEASVEKLESLIEDLTNQLNEKFAEGIEEIGKEFSRLFALMFSGGAAKLLLVKPKIKKRKQEEDDLAGLDGVPPEGPEEDEEAEEGIEIDVKLPNKRVRGLDMLSGGERALTSIALIFAMSQVNPPLFIILDETDAALDEANSRRYGDMIEALAKKSQLILITHNRETMSRAGVLYGVTMAGDGVSKLLSIKFDDAVAVAK